jgi:hypothetical protein
MYYATGGGIGVGCVKITQLSFYIFLRHVILVPVCLNRVVPVCWVKIHQ